MKKLLVLVLIAVILGGCSTTKKDKTITVLTSSGYPPYETVDANGKLQGFDVDLGNAIAAQMGLTIEWKDMDFDGIIAALNSKQADFAMAGMNNDPARAVDWSTVYKKSGSSPFYVLSKKSNNMTTTADIKGKIAGVQIGTIQEAALQKIQADYSLKLDPRKDNALMVQEIIVGRIDFILMEQEVAQEYIKSYPELTAFQLVDAKIVNADGVAVAFPQGSTMVKDVDAALAKLQADGTIDKLIAKWFTE